jgi:DNA polymerase III subunit delta'
MPDFMNIDHSESGEQADRFGEYPHPRQMLVYGGPPEQERLLLDAYRGGRMHHGWLFAGPEGVGKAVLAYRFARFLMAHPDPAAPAVQAATDLSVPAEHPVAGQIARQSHPDLAVIRRGLTKDGKALRTETAVDDVRDGLSVFRTTSGSGGWRIAIVDTADDLNRNSANALLKMLEEPPERALFILIAQRPGSLLPTIRSRCRMLRFHPLAEGAVADIVRSVADVDPAEARAAAVDSNGSVRAALARLDPDQKALAAAAQKAMDAGDWKAAQTLADSLTGRTKADAFETFLDIVENRLRAGVQSGGAAQALAARAELWEKLRRSAREVETFNLDRRPFILSVLGDLAEIERRAR